MSEYLQRLVRPTAAPVRPAQAALQEIQEVIESPAAPAAPSSPSKAGQRVDSAPRTGATTTRETGLQASRSQRSQPAPGATREMRIDKQVIVQRELSDTPLARATQRESDGPQDTRQRAAARASPSLVATDDAAALAPAIDTRQDATAQTLARPNAAQAPLLRPESRAVSSRSETPGRQELSAASDPSVLAARPATREPPGDVVEVHVGSIALTVIAPAPAARAVAPVVHAPAPAPAAPARAAPARDGLGFSASRHYLRWS